MAKQAVPLAYSCNLKVTLLQVPTYLKSNLTGGDLVEYLRQVKLQQRVVSSSLFPLPLLQIFLLEPPGLLLTSLISVLCTRGAFCEHSVLLVCLVQSLIQ